MKTLYCLLIIATGCALSSATGAKCYLSPYVFSKNWMDMVDPCISAMRQQVKEELGAAITYMAMGAHFSKDVVNRPGFSNFFFAAANEEREHAIKIIEYLLMRGELTSNIKKLIHEPIVPRQTEWKDGVTALNAALELESYVTRKIRDIIKTCEEPPADKKGVVFNDYHLVDYLTGDFLDEQLKGQRELAGKISTLGKLVGKHGALGEFLFDKKLLNGEPL